jgi:hypothetical protein
MTAEAKPVILSVQLCNAALGDPAFYTALPEFIGMKRKLLDALALMNKPGGCGGCRKGRITRELFTAFVSTAVRLDDDAKSRLRAYYNVPSLMVSVQTPNGKITVI